MIKRNMTCTCTSIKSSNSFEKSGLKPYVDMNSGVTKEAKNNFEKKLLSWEIM